MKSRITIGRLAAASGVGVETIRFYQRSGLLAEPRRPALGYREYGEADVRRIRFIKRAQTLGFGLQDIADLLKLDGPQTCRTTHDLALTKLQAVKSKIDSLKAIEKALKFMIRQCDLDHETGTCPIIQALVQDQPY